MRYKSVAWQESPGERGKCANWATVSADCVLVWPLHLWEQVHTAWGQQQQLLHYKVWESQRLQDEHAVKSLHDNLFQIHFNKFRFLLFYKTDDTFINYSGDHILFQSTNTLLEHVAWYHSCATPIFQSVDLTLGTNHLSRYTQSSNRPSTSCANYCWRSETLHLSGCLPQWDPSKIEQGHCIAHADFLMGKWFPDLWLFLPPWS